MRQSYHDINNQTQYPALLLRLVIYLHRYCLKRTAVAQLGVEGEMR